MIKHLRYQFLYLIPILVMRIRKSNPWLAKNLNQFNFLQHKHFHKSTFMQNVCLSYRLNIFIFFLLTINKYGQTENRRQDKMSSMDPDDNIWRHDWVHGSELQDFLDSRRIVQIRQNMLYRMPAIKITEENRIQSGMPIFILIPISWTYPCTRPSKKYGSKYERNLL